MENAADEEPAEDDEGSDDEGNGPTHPWFFIDGSGVFSNPTKSEFAFPWLIGLKKHRKEEEESDPEDWQGSDLSFQAWLPSLAFFSSLRYLSLRLWCQELAMMACYRCSLSWGSRRGEEECESICHLK